MNKPGVIHLRSFHIGVDLGQRVDHTAFVVLEQQIISTTHRDPISFEYARQRRLGVCLIERVALGTGFSKIANALESLTHNDRFKDGRITTCLDATGIGSVVTEDLERRRLRGELFPVEITGGRADGYRKGFYTTPRTELLRAVERIFDQDDLVIAPEVAMWQELRDEMKAMRKLHSPRGPYYATYGKHDDLVFALALALYGVRLRELPAHSETLRRRLGL